MLHRLSAAASRLLPFALAVAIAAPAFSQRSERYALILKDSPLVSKYSSRAELFEPAAAAERTRIESQQLVVKQSLETRKFVVTGASSMLLNALYVSSTPERLAELKSIPGVLGVVKLRKFKPTLSQAVQIMNGPAAWNLVGGMPNGGKGIKIGVIDTGIDQNHPSLQDSTLSPVQVPGGTRHADSDPKFTNSKVIVARSYVRQLAVGTGTIDPSTSSPDDYSARDRVGHGTAVATCAAGNSSTDVVTINGMAPKAYLGNYKVYGSPEVNDGASEDVLIAALEDAVADGMDIINISSGLPAFSGPLDIGAVCGNPDGVACDLVASAYEAAAQKGIVILASAGNSGANGWVNYPTFNTVASPATAPSVLAVGAIANSHTFQIGVRVSGANVPATVASIPGQFTDAGFTAYGAISAPLVDVATLGNDGYLCLSVPQGSLRGSLALVQRGPQGASACSFDTKMANATGAGATGVVFYDYPGSPDYPFSPSGLSTYSQQAVLISNADGINLKAYLAANPGHAVIIDPAAAEEALAYTPELSSYSSMGPALGTNAIKPDVLAVGAGSQNNLLASGGASAFGDLLFMGAQSYDPLGGVYSATGYIAAAGTSFASPLAAGAAALVKQAHPTYSAAQIRSALANTAAQDVTLDDSGNPVSVLQTGAGRVAADAAIKTNVTVVPSSLSFGALPAGTASAKIPLTITNTGGSSVNLALALTTAATASSAKLALDKTSIALAAGASTTVTASLSGTAPTAGLYSGVVTVTGGTVPLRIPWMFLVGSTSVDGTGNLLVLLGDQNDGTVGQVLPDGGVAFLVTDGNGVPIPNLPVTFSANVGSVPVTITGGATTTDRYGIAFAVVTLGSQSGSYSIEGCVGKCSNRNAFEYTFTGNVREPPTILPGGIVSSAASTPSAPIAPGSYVSIYGTGLSDGLDSVTTAGLPLAIDYVNVSFDVPSAGISVPGRIVFVSPSQINVQVPWELQGQTSAQVKVTVDHNPGPVVTVPVADTAPGLFEYGTGNAAAFDINSLGVVTKSNPASRGGVVELFGNGLGPVTNQPASGEVAPPAGPLSVTKNPVSVTIGGQNANVLFSGLTPGLPGLYQINVTVPTNIGPGSQPVVVTVAGKASQATMLQVK